MKYALFLVPLVALSACAVRGVGGSVTVYESRSFGHHPAYVYVYEDGACWVDDVYYAACPWTFGPERRGYYWSYQGHWFWHEHYAWRNRHRPPPRVWRHPPVVIPRHPHHGTWSVDPPRRRLIAPPVPAR